MKKGAIDLKSVVFDEESKSGPGGWLDMDMPSIPAPANATLCYIW